MNDRYRLWTLTLICGGMLLAGVTSDSQCGPLSASEPTRTVALQADREGRGREEAGQNEADQDDDEPVQIPGLLAKYTSNDGPSVLRRESDIAFVWGQSAPDQRLHVGPFRATWTGKLLIRSPGKFRFHAQLQGKVEVRLGKHLVLQGQSDQPTWISGPEVPFVYGEHPLQVEFNSGVSASQIKLYWSSGSIAFEPVPPAALFLNEPHPELELESRGRQQFAAHRCNRCHLNENDPISPPGPDLTSVSMGLQERWLERWLTAPSKISPHASMPEFGFSDEEARAISAFLRQQCQPVTIAVVKTDPAQAAAQTEAGRLLFHSLGCLACHGTGLKGHSVAFGGGDLSKIGEKRSLDWLYQWLKEPAKLNADHRMPVFTLKRDGKADEALQLATYLSRQGEAEVRNSQAGNVPPAGTDLLATGRNLVEAARCAACHRIPGTNSKLAGIPQLGRAGGTATTTGNSCLQNKPDRTTWRPAYPLADHAAIRAYLATRTKPLTPESSHEQGQRLLAWNNCLACHPRDGGTGIGPNAALAGDAVPALKGQGPTLVPPSLNAVGDKLLTEWLRQAVAGEIAASRLPWLRIRMPRFQHSQADREALAQYFIQHDKIDAPPHDIAAIPPIPPADARFQALAAGHTLLGSQGFSCIACHSFGKFEPRNTALGTRGSDLRLIGQRMRREFFLRWTRSPIRIVPNMEMPSFERPVEGLLDGRIDSQLAALWESLQDANSSRPLEVSAVQQNLIVKAGEPARIVRDVFSVSQQGQDTHIPRSFAVGFSNQHNILFDLDTFRLREWWLGDFARQRTEGKSWYWDLGGVRVATDLGQQANLIMVRGQGDKVTSVEPTSKQGVSGTLLRYAREGGGVKLAYRLSFPSEKDDAPFEISVDEFWGPLEVSAKSPTSMGWKREIQVSGIPEGYHPALLRPISQSNTGGFDVSTSGENGTEWQKTTFQGSPEKSEPIELSRFRTADPRQATASFTYTAKNAPVTRAAPQPVVQNANQEPIHTVPGYATVRLPLPRSIMPTAITWMKDRTLALASLKGHVYLVRDTNGDGVEDRLDLFEEGLAAPYGLIADDKGSGLLVSHKPELLRLQDVDGDGRADLREVVATGWGYNDNYHDWTCGIVRDSQGRLYVGLGSDYTQPKRPRDQQRWRGKVLRIDRDGKIEPIASGLRYPTGLAITPDDDLFVTDNQGEQNTFNELNHIVTGERYGVPSIEDKSQPAGPSKRPAIQIPHPWTRSVNGIFFLPRDNRLATGESHPFAGHGIGCEYDTRYLIRFSLQKVGDTFQGAVYPFSLDQVPADVPNFEGTLCGGVSPTGDIYIGCIHDSGWLGGLNVGSLYQLRQAGKIPLGIREIRVTSDGFTIDFTEAIDPKAAADVKQFAVAAYTREWQGDYATPDSQRHQVVINSVQVASDHRQVTLHTDKLREGFVYEITCGKIGTNPTVALWPATGHYTVNRIP